MKVLYEMEQVRLRETETIPPRVLVLTHLFPSKNLGEFWDTKRCKKESELWNEHRRGKFHSERSLR